MPRGHPGGAWACDSAFQHRDQMSCLLQRTTYSTFTVIKSESKQQDTHRLHGSCSRPDHDTGRRAVTSRSCGPAPKIYRAAPTSTRATTLSAGQATPHARDPALAPAAPLRSSAAGYSCRAGRRSVFCDGGKPGAVGTRRRPLTLSSLSSCLHANSSIWFTGSLSMTGREMVLTEDSIISAPYCRQIQ